VEKLRLSWDPLDGFNKWKANPKWHRVDGIAESIRRYGMDDPVAVNDRTGKLVEGHGRVEALRSMQAAGEPPPPNVKEKDGRWLVPTVHLDLDAVSARAYALVHNRAVEAGGWARGSLAGLLRSLSQELAGAGIPGFDGAFLQALAAVAPDLGRLDPGRIGLGPSPDGSELGTLRCPHCGHSWPETL
jgi:hypothetical protein